MNPNIYFTHLYEFLHIFKHLSHSHVILSRRFGGHFPSRIMFCREKEGEKERKKKCGRPFSRCL